MVRCKFFASIFIGIKQHGSKRLQAVLDLPLKIHPLKTIQKHLTRWKLHLCNSTVDLTWNISFKIHLPDLLTTSLTYWPWLPAQWPNKAAYGHNFMHHNRKLTGGMCFLGLWWVCSLYFLLSPIKLVFFFVPKPYRGINFLYQHFFLYLKTTA